MEIVTELAGNATTLLQGAINAMQETRRQINFVNPPRLRARLRRIDKAIRLAEDALYQLDSLKPQQRTPGELQ
jgi:hypothetical protein